MSEKIELLHYFISKLDMAYMYDCVLVINNIFVIIRLKCSCLAFISIDKIEHFLALIPYEF